jgi:hypothetical protein
MQVRVRERLIRKQDVWLRALHRGGRRIMFQRHAPNMAASTAAGTPSRRSHRLIGMAEVPLDPGPRENACNYRI